MNLMIKGSSGKGAQSVICCKFLSALSRTGREIKPQGLAYIL